MYSYHNSDYLISGLTKGLILSSSILIFASCSSTLTIDKRAPFQTIEKQRGNIVTESRLSNASSTSLRSAGIDTTDCIENIDRCTERLAQNAINAYDQDSLAVLAELHLAKAKDISASDTCQVEITRPPINPYYANAPLSDDNKQKRASELRTCRQDYRLNVLASIKNSYAYLFYNYLPSESASTHTQAEKKVNYLTKDLDVQTQDVYEAASDGLIQQLYSQRFNLNTRRLDNNHEKKDNADKTHTAQTNANEPYEATVTYFMDSHLFDLPSSHDEERVEDAYSPSQPSTRSSPYGEQVKLLNITLETVQTTNLTSEPTPYDDAQPDNAIENVLTSNTVADTDATITEARTDISTTQAGLNNSPTPVSIDVYLPNEPEYLQNSSTYQHPISELYASHDFNFSGLNTVSEREGVGVSYVALFEGRLDTSVLGLLKNKAQTLNATDPLKRIHLTGNVLASGIVVPEGNTLQAVLNSHHFDIEFYNPHHTEAADILGKPYSLAANFSASYGLWLEENGLNNVGYFNLLSRQQALTLPQLYMLEPYDPNKRVIVMLHGLASSPATWVSVTNDIFNDATLRKNYQVWQIFYPTNIPILENRYQIQKLIETAYQRNDPAGTNAASQHSILVGHSMGGVIGRLMLSNDNLKTKVNTLDRAQQNKELNNLINSEINQQNIDNRLDLQKLANVDEAVFVSAPFRGTDFADRWFTRALRNIVQLPIGFAQTITGNLAHIATQGELTENPLGALYLQNGASQLSDKSSFMQVTADVQIADDVTYHTIIANRDSDIYQGLQQLNVIAAPQTQLSEQPDIDPTNINQANSDDLSVVATPLKPQPQPKPAKRPLDTLSNQIEETLDQPLSVTVTDGIVPYSSAHLEGATSENIIPGGHGIHEKPEAVLLLRKILHHHLDKYPLD